MNPNYGLMVELKPEFQRRLFSELLKKYKGSINLSKVLNRSASALRNYKNCWVKSIPYKILIKAVNLSLIPKQELHNNIITMFNAKKQRKKNFEIGTNLRRDYLKEHFKFELPLESFLEKENEILYINIEKWLNLSKWFEKVIVQKGILRNVKKPIIKNGKITLDYEAYNKRTKSIKRYINTMPAKIKVDEALLYFLGLRYGDGTNGAKIWVVNKNLELIKNTSDYLRDLFPNSEVQGNINVYKNIKDNQLNYLKEFMSKISDYFMVYNPKNNKINCDYVLCIFVINEVFNKIYNNLIKEFKSFFEVLTFIEKGAFLAGFFDAEGNVNKLDKNFRWSQKIKEKVKFIGELLENECYHFRYDGSNFIIGHKKEFWKQDLELFKKQVLPYIKHPEKLKEAKELLGGYYVRDCYKELVNLVNKYPGINNEDISKLIGRKRSHKKLTALTEAEFVKRNRKSLNESFKYHITEKGFKWINGVD